MARKTIYECDRCETQYPTDRSLTAIRVMPLSVGTPVVRNVELCNDCRGDFWSEFMKEDDA